MCPVLGQGLLTPWRSSLKGVIRRKGYQGHDTCVFNGSGKLPLVLGTGTSDSSWQYLAMLSNKMAQKIRVFVIHNKVLVCTEPAYFASYINPASFHWSAWSLHFTYSFPSSWPASAVSFAVSADSSAVSPDSASAAS